MKRWSFIEVSCQGKLCRRRQTLGRCRGEESHPCPLIVMFQCLLLEASDAEHLAEEVDLLRRLEARIEKLLGKVYTF